MEISILSGGSKACGIHFYFSFEMYQKKPGGGWFKQAWMGDDKQVINFIRPNKITNIAQYLIALNGLKPQHFKMF